MTFWGIFAAAKGPQENFSPITPSKYLYTPMLKINNIQYIWNFHTIKIQYSMISWFMWFWSKICILQIYLGTICIQQKLQIYPIHINQGINREGRSAKGGVWTKLISYTFLALKAPTRDTFFLYEVIDNDVKGAVLKKVLAILGGNAQNFWPLKYQISRCFLG